jgi:hypothetical protein
MPMIPGGVPSMADLTLEELGPMLAEYADRVKSWKADHDAAMKCRDLESDVVMGVALLLAIDVIDMNWRTEVFGGKADHDAAEEQAIETMYREWSRLSSPVLSRIEQMEAEGYQVKWSDQFRRTHRDARGVVTPDTEFFAGDSLIEQRDAAIVAYREGRTVEFHELGD